MISAVVLAAGRGDRMGDTKQLLMWAGKPLLQHVLERAAEADEVVLVLGHCADEITSALELPAGTTVTINDRYAEGQATSLRAGLEACSAESEAAVVLLGDNPQIEPGAVSALIEAWRGSDRPIVRTVYSDRPGHPVVLGRSLWLRLPNDGDEGARVLMFDEPELVFDHRLEGPAPIDVDTAADLEALLRC